MATNALNRVIQHLRRTAVGRDSAGLADAELLDYYLARRDERAFEALVRRHGPMVLGVCRRILRNEADAEDAFQATFLILVRKAGNIRPRGMVSNWLYGVAHNTALKAKAMIRKRRTKEREAGKVTKPEAAEAVCCQVQTVVDEELGRLPDKYRVAIVLCDLEGKTIKEAARHLDWPQGTVATRLARGRALLAKRLRKHGLTLSVGPLAAVLSQGAASASVPAPLVASTVKAASLYATGKAVTTGVVSATVAALTEGVLTSMLLTKLKIVTAALLVIATVAVGLRGLMYETQASAPANKRIEPGAKAKDQELEKLQGTWILISTERQGKQTFEDQVKEAKIQLVISGDSFTLKTARNEEGLKGKLKIDPTQQPKTMDWSANRPEDGQGLNAKGIYELKGDILKFCYGKERPTEFKTKPDRDLDMRMRVFKREKPAAKPISLKLEAAVQSVEWSSDGKLVATRSYRWEKDPTGQRDDADRNLTILNAVAFAPDGKVLATGGDDGTIRLWGVQSGKVSQVLEVGSTGRIFSLAFSPDGKRLISAGADGRILLWDILKREAKPLEEISTRTLKVLFSHNGEWIAAGGVVEKDDKRMGEVRLFDARTGRLVRTWDDAIPSAVSFAPDSRTLVIGHTDGTVKMWRVKK